MAVKATVTEPAERTISLLMPESEARRLKHLMLYEISWETDRFGKTAERVYDALDGVQVSEKLAKE